MFDYEQSTDAEKPSGIDIKEKKMTLPLIYLLEKSSYFERRKIIYTIKNKNTDQLKVNEIIKLVKQSGGIEYATLKMLEYKDKALNFLKDQPESEYKESLIKLLDYTTDRKK